MWRRRLAVAAMVAGLVTPSLTSAQPSDRVAETHYQNGLAAFKRTPPDYVDAAAGYRKAADLGHAAAQNNLGWLYQNGWGVPKSDAEAVRWYRLAATRGNVTGQVNLGFMYQNGRGVARDPAEAVRWYRQAVAQGSLVAMDNLGVLYRDGLGVPRDHAQAVALFRKAADGGYRWGQTDLGWMYHNGWGVPRDYAQAMTWYRRAAAQGDALAQNNLGVIYRDGLGVPRDVGQALAWFRRAAAAGDARARQSLRHLESRERGMDPWSNILAGKSVRVSISAQGLVHLYGETPVRLPAGNTITVDVPIKIFTDPELRQLGVRQPNGSLMIKGTPNLPYKPMRAASQAQKRRFFEDYAKSAVAIYWPPYVVNAPGVDKQPAGSKDVVREAIERLYER